MSWDKNIKNYYDTKKMITKTIKEEAGFHELVDSLMEEMSDAMNESWQNSRKWQVIKEDEEGSDNIKAQKAEEFVLSLPKFTPTEAWGKPSSMERQQIDKIFRTVGGGASIKKKIEYMNKTIYNPDESIGSRGGTRRILGALIIMESLAAVIRSFNEASAGFVFEGFLSALLGGKQEAGRNPSGNLPIEDLIAFSEWKGSSNVPVSLKLLGQTTKVEGSYTNLIDALLVDHANTGMVYLVCRKDGEQMSIESFQLTSKNFIDAIAYSGGGLSASGKVLFAGKDGTAPEQMIAKIKGALEAEDEKRAYDLLKSTKGYTKKADDGESEEKQKKSWKVDGVDYTNYEKALANPKLWGAPNTSEKFEAFFEKAAKMDPVLLAAWNSRGKELEPAILQTLYSADKYFKSKAKSYKKAGQNVVGDGLTMQVGDGDEKMPLWAYLMSKPTKARLGSSQFATAILEPITQDAKSFTGTEDFINALFKQAKKGKTLEEIYAKTPYTVEENKILWEQVKGGLLTENKGGTQWNISPAELSNIQGIKYDVLGTLPYSDKAVVQVAVRYIDILQDGLAGLFAEVKNLSENVNNYFFKDERSEAITNGSDAITSAKNAADKLETEVEAERAGDKEILDRS